MSPTLINANPTVYETAKRPRRVPVPTTANQGEREAIDQEEIFDLIRTIADPEHPMTLEQLAVVNAEHITVSDEGSYVRVDFTPTIPHCSMATLIGLCIRVRLLRSLPPRFKADIYVREGTHQSEVAVNKQLNDKERVAAAMENRNLLEVVDSCLGKCDELMMQEDEAGL